MMRNESYLLTGDNNAFFLNAVKNLKLTLFDCLSLCETFIHYGITWFNKTVNETWD